MGNDDGHSVLEGPGTLTQEEVDEAFELLNKTSDEIKKVIRGQETIINSVIRAMISRGHILMEGLPGLGKTVLCRVLSDVCELDFKRVQFTTDLLPSDIIGIVTYTKEEGFSVIKGPVFANLMLADEINRAPPKVQSALLEAMGEKQVTISKDTHKLMDPFFVMATQNPIEQAGTFPLPEAQMDRFLFKTNVLYPDFESEFLIMEANFNTKKSEDFSLEKVLTPEKIINLQHMVPKIHIERSLKYYILKIVNSTRTPDEFNLKHGELIKVGASPRATINILLACRAEALMNGRYYVIPQDIKNITHEVLRHRIQLNFKAKMENISVDDVIDDILKRVKIH